MKRLKKVNNVETNGPEVPFDIFSNILSRLPLKTRIKCKLVCKEWYQLIESPEFAKLLSIIQDRYLYLTILPNSRRKHFTLLKIDKSSKVDETGDLIIGNDAIISSPKFCCSFLVNECNGLSLLVSRGTCIVFNHIKGEQVPVIYPYDYVYGVDFGLGYCPVSEQFKILKIVNNVARIQTLGSEEWRIVEDAPASYPRSMSSNKAAFLHGSLHRYSKEENIVWCFDFETERFWQISTPDGFNTKYRSRIRVCVFNSCLCLTSFSREEGKKVCEVWVMKEYGVKDSWVKQFVVPVGAKSTAGLAAVPLFEMDNGKLLFTSFNYVNLKSYDIESKIWRNVKIPGNSSGAVQVMHHANNIRFSKFHSVIQNKGYKLRQ